MSDTTKMSAKQRIDALVDANSFVEIGAYVTKRNTDFNMNEKTVPADGVITGYGLVDENLVFVYSQDATAMNGSVGEMHAKKIANLYEMAIKAGAPVIALVDCAGVRVQEALDALEGFGEIYLAKVNASGVIPMYTAILGSCGGGVAISSKLSDITIMDSANGKLFVNSPNAIEGNHIGALDTSNAEFQGEAGNVDIVCENESQVIDKIKDLISILPANCDDVPFTESDDDLNRVLTGFDAYALDAKEALTQIADDNKFIELKADFGKEMVVGFMTVSGYTVGAVANSKDAVFSTKGCKKAEQFVYFCDSFGIPVVTLTNVEGYKATKCEEKSIAQAVADLTYAFASSDVPRINIITGKAYGSAYVAMNSKHIGADLVIAIDSAKVGVMDSKVASMVMYGDETKTAEYDKVQNLYEGAAKRGYVDNVVKGDDVRKHLIYALQMFGMR